MICFTIHRYLFNVSASSNVLNIYPDKLSIKLLIRVPWYLTSNSKYSFLWTQKFLFQFQLYICWSKDFHDNLMNLKYFLNHQLVATTAFPILFYLCYIKTFIERAIKLRNCFRNEVNFTCAYLYVCMYCIYRLVLTFPLKTHNACA